MYQKNRFYVKKLIIGAGNTKQPYLKEHLLLFPEAHQILHIPY